jgi:hypothetical protein
MRCLDAHLQDGELAQVPAPTLEDAFGKGAKMMPLIGVASRFVPRRVALSAFKDEVARREQAARRPEETNT